MGDFTNDLAEKTDEHFKTVHTIVNKQDLEELEYKEISDSVISFDRDKLYKRVHEFFN